MPLSVRFNERSEKLLDRLKRAGRFESKADAVREALNTYELLLRLRRRGYRIVALPAAKARRMRLAFEIT